MRAWPRGAVTLVIAGSLAGAALAQIPPPTELLPEASGQPPAPPPTTLLPPGESDLGASDMESGKLAEPPKRVRRAAAILQALDKTTAETMRFEAPVNQPIRYKNLVIIVHVCEDAGPAQNQRGAAAHLEIDSDPRPAPGKAAPPSRQLFKGWMFADAPGIHPFEHPVYDAWLIACKAASPPA